MTLAEFFTETGVKFMDDFTCPRYSMAAGLGDEILAGALHMPINDTLLTNIRRREPRAQ